MRSLIVVGSVLVVASLLILVLLLVENSASKPVYSMPWTERTSVTANGKADTRSTRTDNETLKRLRMRISKILKRQFTIAYQLDSKQFGGLDPQLAKEILLLRDEFGPLARDEIASMIDESKANADTATKLVIVLSYIGNEQSAAFLLDLFRSKGFQGITGDWSTAFIASAQLYATLRYQPASDWLRSLASDTLSSIVSSRDPESEANLTTMLFHLAKASSAISPEAALSMIDSIIQSPTWARLTEAGISGPLLTAISLQNTRCAILAEKLHALFLARSSDRRDEAAQFLNALLSLNLSIISSYARDLIAQPSFQLLAIGSLERNEDSAGVANFLIDFYPSANDDGKRQIIAALPPTQSAAHFLWEIMKQSKNDRTLLIAAMDSLSRAARNSTKEDKQALENEFSDMFLSLYSSVTNPKMKLMLVAPALEILDSLGRLTPGDALATQLIGEVQISMSSSSDWLETYLKYFQNFTKVPGQDLVALYSSSLSAERKQAVLSRMAYFPRDESVHELMSKEFEGLAANRQSDSSNVASIVEYFRARDDPADRKFLVSSLCDLSVDVFDEFLPLVATPENLTELKTVKQKLQAALKDSSVLAKTQKMDIEHKVELIEQELSYMEDSNGCDK